MACRRIARKIGWKIGQSADRACPALVFHTQKLSSPKFSKSLNPNERLM